MKTALSENELGRLLRQIPDPEVHLAVALLATTRERLESVLQLRWSAMAVIVPSSSSWSGSGQLHMPQHLQAPLKKLTQKRKAD